MFFMAPRSHTDSKKLAHFGIKFETICNISAGHLQALVIAGIPGATSLWLLCFIDGLLYVSALPFFGQNFIIFDGD